MRVDASIQGRVPARSRTPADDAARTAELIAELATAGLVSADVGDDGATSYALTPAGSKAACQMAMRGDAYALVLLGALVASSEGLN